MPASPTCHGSELRDDAAALPESAPSSLTSPPLAKTNATGRQPSASVPRSCCAAPAPRAIPSSAQAPTTPASAGPSAWPPCYHSSGGSPTGADRTASRGIEPEGGSSNLGLNTHARHSGKDRHRQVSSKHLNVWVELAPQRWS